MAALQCHLGGPMSSDKGPRTKKAGKFHGMLQNKPLENSVRSIVERATEDKSLNLFRSVVQGAVKAGS